MQAQGHASGKLEDKFAENLAKALVDGEIAVGDWSADKGASINVCASIFSLRIQFGEAGPSFLVDRWDRCEDLGPDPSY